jgi:hypothetical protein
VVSTATEYIILTNVNYLYGIWDWLTERQMKIETWRWWIKFGESFFVDFFSGGLSRFFIYFIYFIVWLHILDFFKIDEIRVLTFIHNTFERPHAKSSFSLLYKLLN